jgi:hypothetical protein
VLGIVKLVKIGFDFYNLKTSIFAQVDIPTPIGRDDRDG